jgi:UDP-N-acetylglucosamine--N-acetylmuramyl-(pentapeptide) pyrophosphoryl-undecaprenol N-acetylglucosamine transferase
MQSKTGKDSQPGRLKPKLILTGGGTGGHVLPLLALAKALESQFEIFYIGSLKGPEAYLVPAASISFLAIASGKFRRYFSLENFWDFFSFLRGFWQAFFILKRLKPALVFAKGGYVSLPVVLAARVLGLKIFIHESDAALGLSNRIAALFARKIFVAFPKRFYPSRFSGKMVVSGIPVLEDLKEELRPSKEKNLILISGGLQGALGLNRLVLSVLPELLAKYKVVHQTGEASYSLIAEFAKGLPPSLKKNYLFKKSFLASELLEYRRQALLAISRAGATTLYEQAKWGLPMILVPLPSSANNHQLINALYLESLGAAVVVREERAGDKFPQIVFKLLEDKERLEAMRQNSQKFALINAVEVIKREIAKTLYEEKT